MPAAAAGSGRCVGGPRRSSSGSCVGGRRHVEVAVRQREDLVARPWRPAISSSHARAGLGRGIGRRRPSSVAGSVAVGLAVCWTATPVGLPDGDSDSSPRFAVRHGVGERARRVAGDQPAAPRRGPRGRPARSRAATPAAAPKSTSDRSAAAAGQRSRPTPPRRRCCRRPRAGPVPESGSRGRRRPALVLGGMQRDERAGPAVGDVSSRGVRRVAERVHAEPVDAGVLDADLVARRP